MRDYDGFEQKIPFIATGDSPFEGDWYQDSPDLMRFSKKIKLACYAYWLRNKSNIRRKLLKKNME